MYICALLTRYTLAATPLGRIRSILAIDFVNATMLARRSLLAKVGGERLRKDGGRKNRA